MTAWGEQTLIPDGFAMGVQLAVPVRESSVRY